MKRIILATGLTITVLGVGNMALAQEQAVPAVQPTATTQTRPGSVISDIEVPFDVLMYVQMEHQGYAVTEASKLSRSGQQVYRLRVDQDDSKADYDSFYLLYDSNWKLLGKDNMVPPPKPKTQEPKPAKTPQPRATAPAPPPVQGGRGGGIREEPPRESPPPEPTPAPTPSPEPANPEGNTAGQ